MHINLSTNIVMCNLVYVNVCASLHPPSSVGGAEVVLWQFGLHPQSKNEQLHHNGKHVRNRNLKICAVVTEKARPIGKCSSTSPSKADKRAGQEY